MSGSLGTAAWCALSAVDGVGPVKLKEVAAELHRRRTGAESLIGMSEQDLHGIGLNGKVAERASSALRNPIAFPAPDGGWVLTPDDEWYPRRRLLSGKLPLPAVLFAAGDRSVLRMPAVALVGSRRAGPSVLELAADLARLVVAADAIVVSGLAQGVDEASHVGAIAAGGGTIAVLAEGIGQSRRAQRCLAQSDDGILVVSQFRDDDAWVAGQAMQRNATIAALADLVVVVASDTKGGSWEMGNLCLKKQMNLAVVDLDPAIAPGNERMLKRGALRIDPEHPEIPEVSAGALLQTAGETQSVGIQEALFEQG